jgi:hypothetical protein
LTFRSRSAPILANHPARLQFFAQRRTGIVPVALTIFLLWIFLFQFCNAASSRARVFLLPVTLLNIYFLGDRRSLDTIAVIFQSLSRAIMRNNAAVARLLNGKALQERCKSPAARCCGCSPCISDVRINEGDEGRWCRGRCLSRKPINYCCSTRCSPPEYRQF